MQNDMRKRLIELIKIYDESFSCDDCRNYTGDGCGYGCLADHLIANGVIVPQWISVDDRLPEKNGRYLTTVCNYKGEVNVFDLWYDNTDWLIDEGDDSYEYEVTHWMLLPEPPKAE